MHLVGLTVPDVESGPIPEGDLTTMKRLICGASIGMLALFGGVACSTSDTTTPSSSSSSTPSSTSSSAPSSTSAATTTHQAPAPAPANGGTTTTPHHTAPKPAPTTPCEGTICTNPNHGAGTNPNENGTDNGHNPDGS